MTAAQRAVFWELLGKWALAFGLIIVFVIFTSQGKTAATVAFLYIPIYWIDRHDKTVRDFGLRFDRWRDDLKALAVMVALVFPPFIACFWGFVQLLPHLPAEWVALATPYGGELPHLAFHLPDPPLPPSLVTGLGWVGVSLTGTAERAVALGLLVVDQFLVVALAEEFFYRGFLQTRLREAFPQGRVWLGVKFGPAFWITQALFAVGHLAEFHPWRLAVFFPAVLFGMLRERTGRLPAGIAFHALCNLAIFTLEASAFAR